MPKTIDGYPYPTKGGPDNNWQWLKDATWKSSSSANQYLAYIGERKLPGIALRIGEFYARNSKKAVKWVMDFFQIDDKQTRETVEKIVEEVYSYAQKKFEGKVNELMGQVYKELKKNGVDFYLDNYRVPLAFDEKLMDRINTFEGLHDFDKSIVIHHIVNRWADYAEDILAGRFNTDERMKTLITCAVAGTQFTKFSWFQGWKSGREFLAGDGVGLTLAHMASPDKWNPENPDDVRKLTNVCNTIAMFDFNASIQEAEAFFNSVKEKAEEREARQNKKLAGTNNIVNILLLGVALGLIKGVR